MFITSKKTSTADKNNACLDTKNHDNMMERGLKIRVRIITRKRKKPKRKKPKRMLSV